MNLALMQYQTPTRAGLYALMDLQALNDLDVVLKGLERNLKPGAFNSSRDLLVTIDRLWYRPKPDNLREPLDHKPPQVPRLPPPVRRKRRGVAGPSACGFCGQAQCFIVDLVENTAQASVLLARSRQCRAHMLLP